jgi:hypothetical protein
MLNQNAKIARNCKSAAADALLSLKRSITFVLKHRATFFHVFSQVSQIEL